MHSKKWEQRKIEIQNERDSINKSKIRHAGWGDCIITEEEERAREESNKLYLQRQAENEQQQIEQQTITDCMKSVDSILAAEAETIRQMCTSTNNQYKK